ncbi:hypothetical protein FH581_015375 [Leptospira weilii]|uniref:hypothetical protein n=1 Tax=Leptospira weilii TaxID=28184 RepID=UPI001EF38FBB|nr:hypothetical protein [Leptospira weilii]ULH28713.1 hypothetical protein FH586_20910 [Leptospira weilii]ULH30033.1 hypothetical protein FH586_09365 [Leptospira weilii]UPY76780.1 hypothetical protein FH581_012545 [Leptospira weilii]UPY79587.1 hypothetical protein FH581_015375 [Leptospira weilii]
MVAKKKTKKTPVKKAKKKAAPKKVARKKQIPKADTVSTSSKGVAVDVTPKSEGETTNGEN